MVQGPGSVDMPLSIDPLRASLPELERWYLEAPVCEKPRGLFHGRHLAWLPTTAPRWLRPTLVVGFCWLVFGVDFDRDVWFFVDRRLRIGRFRADIGRSRWRDTRAVRLHYDISSLPGRVSGFLYDEVKPIDERRCLGMGGVNAPAGRGEQFFFLLEKEPVQNW